MVISLHDRATFNNVLYKNCIQYPNSLIKILTADAVVYVESNRKYLTKHFDQLSGQLDIYCNLANSYFMWYSWHRFSDSIWVFCYTDIPV